MIITDSWGKILYRTSGYMNSSKTLQILKAFPTDISKINERLKLYFEDKTDPGKAIDVAIAYQEYCDTLKYPAKPAFISESYHFLQQAKKMCDKESDKELIERIQLYKSLNSVYKGSGKGSIKYIETKIGLENISESNKALAYYILVKGYLKLDNSKEAQKNYSSLQECDDCYAYVASLENNF